GGLLDRAADADRPTRYDGRGWVPDHLRRVSVADGDRRVAGRVRARHSVVHLVAEIRRVLWSRQRPAAQPIWAGNLFGDLPDCGGAVASPFWKSWLCRTRRSGIDHDARRIRHSHP